MDKGLLDGPKFLYKVLPVAKLDADFLFSQTSFIMEDMKKVGVNIEAIISDNNRVNQKFFKMFSSSSSWKTNDGQFILFDYVHLLKSIRNNWITETMQELEYVHENEKKLLNGVIYENCSKK